MYSNKKKLLTNLFKSSSSCGCSKLKPTDIFQPLPKPQLFNDQKSITTQYNSSSSSWDKLEEEEEEENYTSTTFSLNLDSLSQNCSEQENDPNISKKLSPSPKISDSIAVVKDSADPYSDFRQSILQMVIEREIYSKDELGELLNRFLELNDPTQHDVIVEAFVEILNEVVFRRPFIQGAGTL